MKTRKIYDFIFDNKITIPTYQRIYTWKKEQIINFIEDIVFDISKERNINLGVMYYDKKSDKEVDMIDGQQRLTTFYLLCNAIIFIDNNNKNKQAKKILSFNKDKRLGTTITTLNYSYDDFYNFINEKIHLENMSNVSKNLKKYISNKGIVGNDDENYDSSEDDVKSELVMGFKAIIDFLTDEENLLYKQMILSKGSDGDYEIFNTEFFPILNPYSEDPISLFERLNNRGMELNFVSLSKIKVHQFIMRHLSLKELPDEKIEELANYYTDAYSKLIYIPFSKLGKTFNADKKDAHVQKALIAYLELKNGTKIGTDKSKALDSLETFLNFNADPSKIVNDFNKNKVYNYLEKVFNHFLYFVSIFALFEKKKKDVKACNYVQRTAVSSAVVSKYSFLENFDYDDLSSIVQVSKLSSIKIEKYNNLLIYVNSIYAYLNGNSIGNIKMESIYEGIFNRAIDYWIDYTKEGLYDLLLRDDLDLDRYLEITKKPVDRKYYVNVIKEVKALNESLKKEKYSSAIFKKAKKDFTSKADKYANNLETKSKKEKIKEIKKFLT